jgi:CheY-like chemotaxis protein
MSEAPRKTVLIVEDEYLVCAMVSIELEDVGYNILAADNGETALAYLVEGREIDLLFTDIKLAGSMDGWTVAQKARELRPDLKVIYATGYAPDVPDLVEGARFFKKPYLPTRVVAAIDEMLA